MNGLKPAKKNSKHAKIPAKHQKKMVSALFLKVLPGNFSKKLKFGFMRLEYESSNQRPEEVPIRKSAESHELVKHGVRKMANVSVSGASTGNSRCSRDPALWESVPCLKHGEDRWYRGICRPFIVCERAFFLWKGRSPVQDDRRSQFKKYSRLKLD